MSFTKLRLPLILALAALLAGGAYWFWGRKPDDVKWRTAPAERGPLQVSVTATGTLQAVVTVQVGTQVSGTVSALYVDFNSKVSKGQVIARIDTTLLRASLSDAASNMEKVAAQERQTAAELKRTEALFARGLVSQADLDQSTANARVAAANLNSARAQVDRARINLRYATIVSPIDGIVLSRAVDVGQTVAASFNTPTLFTIAGDLRAMQVQASVDEADIGKISMGQRATFTVDAYPDSVFTGEVRQIRLQPVTVQNVVSYDVVISVPNPDLKLMPGMTASLTIAVARKEDALTVPAAALRFMPPMPADGKWPKGAKGGDGNRSSGSGNRSSGSVGAGGSVGGARAEGGRSGAPGDDSAGGHRRTREGGDSARDKSAGRVWVLENGKPKPVRVRTGLSDGARTEIMGNLEPGTEVITGVEASAKDQKAAQSSPFGMPRTGGGRGGAGGGGVRAH
ncbi:MAG: Macrolide export protein MacA [Fibrobacteres bacterium]|nr:Macrolide export protein MacA [Fibrobacterota bacterium]